MIQKNRCSLLRGMEGLVHISKVRHPDILPQSPSLAHLRRFRRHCHPLLISVTVSSMENVNEFNQGYHLWVSIAKSHGCSRRHKGSTEYPSKEFRGIILTFLISLRSEISQRSHSGQVGSWVGSFSSYYSFPVTLSLWAVEVDGSCLKLQAEGTQQPTVTVSYFKKPHTWRYFEEHMFLRLTKYLGCVFPAFLPTLKAKTSLCNLVKELTWIKERL